MKWYALLTCSALGLGVIATSAAADALLVAKESVIVAAPVEAVWEAVRNFNDIGWHPAVAKTELVAGNNNERLAVRSLTLKDGGKIVEQLLEYDDAQRRQRYTMLDSPLPVTDYDASIQVSAGERGTVVTWQSRFRRKDAAGTEISNEAAAAMIAGIYAAGLIQLKAVLEAAR